MGDSSDFIERLGEDVSLKIFLCLEDPSDLVRASAVSSSWRRFVIENGLCKQLCLKICPELSILDMVFQLNYNLEIINTKTDIDKVLGILVRDHRVFSFLACALRSFPTKDCISDALSASSTDNFPRERVENTLGPDDEMVGLHTTYWSSKGESDPAVPETLVYKLICSLCLISEIHVQPFQAYFEVGFPIYSAKAVRFHMGHRKSPFVIKSPYGSASVHADDMFVWTYTSPAFTMAQTSNIQKFRLPRPVLCMGGILKIELLGRSQREEIDGLYYICVSHVKAVGRPLGPAFNIGILDFVPSYLKYNREAQYLLSFDDREPKPSPS